MLEDHELLQKFFKRKLDSCHLAAQAALDIPENPRAYIDQT